jgi:outer membrane protein OmpU
MNMNKLHKVGLTALAGSLAAFSAYAGEVSINGGAEMTHVRKHADTGTGNPLGLKKALTFNYSGELDNGWTWAGNTAMLDSATSDLFGGITSAGLAITMGDMGTIKVGQSQNSAMGSIDDVMPTAYEETWNGQATVMARVNTATYGTHIDYNSADLGAGTTIGLTWNPDAGATSSGGGAVNTGNGHAWDAAIKTSLGVDGLTLGGGYGEQEKTSSTNVGGYQNDAWEATWYMKYAMGPITIGYQQHGEDGGSGAVSAVDYYEGEMWGVSFQVNDDLTISYGNSTSEKHMNNEATANVEIDIDAINVSYSMGAASIRYMSSDGSNAGYSSGTNYDHQELNIALSF